MNLKYAASIAIFLFVVIIQSNLVFCKSYSNYTLYRGIPVNIHHLNFLKNMSQHYHVDFWRPPGAMHKPVEFLIPPEEKQTFLRDAAAYDLYLTTIISDVQGAFDKQTVRSYVRRKMESFDWKSYFKLKDIYKWMKDLAKRHPKAMRVYSIGNSYEGRQILCANINLKGPRKRSKVIVEGGIHAREWIAQAFVTYMMHKILTAQSLPQKHLLRTIAETYDWYFVPVLNPDGYEYSHTEDRMWRKNRNGNGVDLNRNFGVSFGTVGVSTNKKDEIYAGPYAFSEKESSAMGNLVRTHSKDLEYYLAFHSYGQLIIMPYAYTNKHLENYDAVKSMADKAAEVIYRKFGTKYTTGTAHDTVGYMTSGVSGCWVKKSFGIPYVLTFELRDEGKHGFALPPKDILPTCIETMEGILDILTPHTEKVIKLPLTSEVAHTRKNGVIVRIDGLLKFVSLLRCIYIGIVSL